MKKNETSDVFQFGFNNNRNLTQPLRKWHRNDLTIAWKSFIGQKEGETEHFTIKNRLPLLVQPLIEILAVYCQK